MSKTPGKGPVIANPPQPTLKPAGAPGPRPGGAPAPVTRQPVKDPVKEYVSTLPKRVSEMEKGTVKKQFDKVKDRPNKGFEKSK